MPLSGRIGGDANDLLALASATDTDGLLPDFIVPPLASTAAQSDPTAAFAPIGGVFDASGGFAVPDLSSADPVGGVPPAIGSISVSRSGNQYIDGALEGGRWNGPVTYSFPDAPADYANPYAGGDSEPSHAGFLQISTQQMQAVRHFFEGISGGPGSIYDPIEAFTNLNFTELAVGSGGADIMIAQSPDANPTAYAYYPANNAAGGDTWFGTNYNYRNPILGTYEYETHIHEIGHTLGLKHGNETTVFGAVPSDRDDLEFTVMTYRSYLNGSVTSGYSNETYGYPQTYMMIDVGALQYLYGADYTYDSGNTTYTGLIKR